MCVKASLSFLFIDEEAGDKEMGVTSQGKRILRTLCHVHLPPFPSLWLDIRYSTSTMEKWCLPLRLLKALLGHPLHGNHQGVSHVVRCIHHSPSIPFLSKYPRFWSKRSKSQLPLMNQGETSNKCSK